MRNGRFTGRQCRGRAYNHQPNMVESVCVSCGFSLKHAPETCCEVLRCPVCNIHLLRGTIINTVKTNQTMTYPKIDTNLCIGCGACQAACRKQAIEMKNDKAYIIEANCKNCKKCIAVCKLGAIS